MKITAKYLTKVFDGGVYALDGFSVNMEHGAIVAVLGESGCGKTTLLRLLSGLEKPTAGELYFDDVLFEDVPIKSRDTAVVFQDYTLYPKMTVWENVAIALERYGLPREEEEARVKSTLDALDLLRFRSQLPRALSGGQQQRVALARAIVRDPSLLLLDEPLSNVAEEKRAEYIRLILKVKERMPRTSFVYVTHNAREAMTVGDYLLIMHEGRCLQFGKKERVWKYPYSAEVLRTLIGDTRELVGKVSGGVFTEDGGDYTCNFDTDFEGDATVIFNSYNDNAPALFDSDGNAVTGEKAMTKFVGSFDGKTVSVCGNEFAADEDFRARFIGNLGGVTVGVPTVLVHFDKRYGDIEIPATKLGDEYEYSGGRATIFGDGFCGKLYISPRDIELFNRRGERTLAHYRVYSEGVPATSNGREIKLPCGSVPCNNPPRGTVRMAFNARARICAVKKGGIRVTVLDEENMGREKLVYCLVKGFSHYVTFRALPEDRFFGIKKLRVAVDPDGVDVR